jgi:hypothetical protein
MRVRHLVVALGFAMGLFGCGQLSPSQGVAAVEADFLVLQQLQVTAYMVVPGCDYIAYARGAFVTDPTSPACELDVEGPHPRLPLDEQARSDLILIRGESGKHGPPLQHAFPSFGTTGAITGGSFGFRLCFSYVYEPSYRPLVKDDSVDYQSVDYQPVNANWYTAAFPC